MTGAAGLEGGFSTPPIDAARAFRAALRALSRPGMVEQVAGARPPAPMSVAAGVLALTLCDHETPVWLAPSLATDEVTGWMLFHTGVPLAPRAEARFAFGNWSEMGPLGDFPTGTPEYPDRSATIVVEVPEMGAAHVLSGPGIAGTARLSLPDPSVFKANAGLFPLGLDFFLTCGDRLAGLPRTTRVEG